MNAYSVHFSKKATSAAISGIILAGLLSLAGCGTKVTIPHPRLFDHSQIVLGLRPFALNPFSHAQSNAWVMNMMYDSLVRVNAHGAVSEDIAASWQIQKNSRQYIFHLNPHAKWWNGRPISVHDVAWTYQLYANPSAPIAASQSLARLVASVTTPNADTVVITLVRPDPGFLANVAAAGDDHPILPAFLVSRIPIARLNQSPVFNRLPDMMGSGPYRPYAEGPNGIRWIANAHYFLGSPKTHILLTQWSTPPKPDVAWGHWHISQTKTLYYPRLTYTMLLFNMNASSLPRPMRLALNALINRYELSRTLGAAIPMTEPVWPSSIYAVSIHLPKADTILRHAGYRQIGGIWHTPQGRPVQVDLTAMRTGQDLHIAQAVKHQLLAAGIPTHLALVSNMHTTLIQHHFVVAVVERRATPFPALAQDFSMTSPTNYGLYDNPAFQVDVTAMNNHPRQLVANEHRALQALFNNPPGAYLVWSAQKVVVAPTVQHLTLNPYNPLETVGQWTVLRSKNP
ncbi:MAG: ABC transporter substrate-binding protein [Sulfobacillus thermotolerans]|nr:ABC transporter substrate-binding protein [Sulfobacillus thermotolerans]